MDADGTENSKQESFDASYLILAFTGSLGSGCSFLAEGVCKELANRAHYYKVSACLHEEAKKSKSNEDVETLQTLGDQLRRDSGRMSILVEKCLEKAKNDDRGSPFSAEEDPVILIDGIKNAGEVEYLRQFPNFYLISVHADRAVRQERLVGKDSPGHRFETVQEFIDADKRDEEEDIPHGQQIKKCNYLADIIINNNENFLDNRPTDRSRFFQEFVHDYIYPMLKVRKGEKPYDRPPRVEETLMTMAYCVSKSSNCLKRKVGAVVACIRKTEEVFPGVERESSDSDLPFQVVSTGYNDVPAGKPCVFSENGRCYRDHLQEEHAKTFKHCPNCGRALPEVIICPRCYAENTSRGLQCEKCKGDLLAGFECEECKCSVFTAYLPGEEKAPGKLLDMCKALHAEENAILGLSGISKGDKAELVLYTTTFPCNLCANKIIASGIRTVYYAEPYTMKESKELLEKWRVKLQKFEGIKSSSYFRLYA